MKNIYHKELGFPKEVQNLFGKTFSLSFSTHAKAACRNDRYGFIIPPTAITITPNNLFEAELEGANITKLAIRQKHTADKDISVVIIPEGLKGFVKTLWLNLSSDTHLTLDKSKYSAIMLT